MRPRLAQIDQSGATDGQVPVWNDTNGLWEPGSALASVALDDLSDVDTTTTAPSDGDVLTYDLASGLWVPAAPAGGGGGGVPPTLPFTAGRYYTMPWVIGTGSGGATQNLLRAIPFLVPSDTSFDRVGAEVTSANASASLRFGLYDDSSGNPSALLYDWGTVSAATTGVKEVTISQAVSAGWYWLACVAQGAAPSLRNISPASNGAVPVGWSTGAAGTPIVGFSVAGVSGALPDPFGALTDLTSAPRIVMRAA